jgi:methionine-rich copper-binding protein CopC
MRVAVALVLSLAVTVALAHAHLQKAVPANGSTVNASPTNVVLSFSEAAKLTACWIQKEGGPKQKISGLAGAPAQEVSVPVPHLDPGTYVLSWRAVGDDGHVVPGQIQFTVAGTAQPTQH